MNARTLEEARKLWCPMVRAGDTGAVNSGRSGPGWNLCVADRCAMWRWSEYPANNTPGTGNCGLATPHT